MNAADGVADAPGLIELNIKSLANGPPNPKSNLGQSANEQAFAEAVTIVS